MARKVLMLVGPEFEDIEALYPYYRLIEEGLEVVVASPSGGRVEGKWGYPIDTVPMDSVRPEEFDALVLPGGRGPERIRVAARDRAAAIVRHFFEARKPVAAICHGPQLLITAGVVRGRRLTSYPGIADDVRAAGGEWVDAPSVVDGNLVTARIPSDIPKWMADFVGLLRSR
ncbi:MAG: type 1 glutamine amidotransferase domain-containing protein [Desulfurococcaceae archaeon]